MNFASEVETRRIYITGTSVTDEHAIRPPTHLYDGDYNTFFHSEIDSYPEGFIITLHLQLSYKISLIRVINRQGCSTCEPERIIGFQVNIIGEKGEVTNCGTITENRPDYDFWTDGVGTKVELKKEATHHFVNIAEIEIYGDLGKI